MGCNFREFCKCLNIVHPGLERACRIGRSLVLYSQGTMSYIPMCTNQRCGATSIMNKTLIYLAGLLELLRWDLTCLLGFTLSQRKETAADFALFLCISVGFCSCEE
jgi:hypothetical protein